jgi:hypothetical protein
MMSLKEIICAPIEPSKLDPKKLEQCQDLTDRVNIIRAAWGKAMSTSSGVRTWADHIRIYKDLAARKRRPFLDGIYDESKVPKKSKHLEIVNDCAAVDVPDEGLKLTAWLKDTDEGKAALEKANLYCENGNKDWVHFQNKPFGSYKKGGTRWFDP